MEEPLKRRLTGTAVIMSLVVIFVPMLVDEEPVVPEEITTTNIPPEPEPLLKEGSYRSEPLVVAEPDPPMELVPAERARVERKPPPPVRPAPPVAAESPSAPPPTPTRPATASPPEERPLIAADPESAAALATNDPGVLKAWVVQVASFSNPRFAQNLVERLRDKGFAAFKGDVRSNGKTWYRVVVGPEVDKQRTIELQNAIVKATGDERLRGAIRVYP